MYYIGRSIFRFSILGNNINKKGTLRVNPANPRVDKNKLLQESQWLLNPQRTKTIPALIYYINKLHSLEYQDKAMNDLKTSITGSIVAKSLSVLSDPKQFSEILDAATILQLSTLFTKLKCLEDTTFSNHLNALMFKLINQDLREVPLRELYHLVDYGHKFVKNGSKGSRYVKNKMVDLFEKNFDRLELNNIFSFMLATDLNKDNSIELTRFLAITKKLEDTLIKYLKQDPNRLNFSDKKVLDSPHFYLTFLKVCRSSKIHQPELINLIIRKIIGFLNEARVSPLKTWMSFYVPLASKGVQVTLLEDWAWSRFKSDISFQKQLISYEKFWVNLCVLAASKQKAMTIMTSLNYQNIGSYKALRMDRNRIDPIRLHPLLEKMASLVGLSVSEEKGVCIKEFQLNEKNQKQSESKKVILNEFNFEFENQLKIQGLEFQREPILGNKSRPDYLLKNQGIVVEVDGDIHQFKNSQHRDYLTLTQLNYRLIVFDNFDFILGRQQNSESIGEKLKKKLEIMLKNPDIIYLK